MRVRSSRPLAPLIHGVRDGWTEGRNQPNWIERQPRPDSVNRNIMEALATNVVETWYLPIAHSSEHPWAKYDSLLSREERDRAARFSRLRDSLHYIAAHALLRVMLSSFSELPPTAWRFLSENGARPEIEPGLSALPLRFSLSHTDRLVAAALTLRRTIGLDV